MNYVERIQKINKHLKEIGSPAKLELEFVENSPPTQAYSEFLTNREQGDWAEFTFIGNFNFQNKNLWAVKYGRSENLVAGEIGFNDHYREYQKELKEIGKRPDILIFERQWFVKKHGNITDISFCNKKDIDDLIKFAKIAIEVRSSAFISNKYEKTTKESQEFSRNKIKSCAKELIEEYSIEVKSTGWYEYCNLLLKKEVEDAGIPPRALSRVATEALATASELTKEIKSEIRELEKRNFLSITPKAEDLSLVYRWILKYGIPHYYCQVFFDKAIMLSFEEILKILSNPDLEKIDYFIEKDIKNQGKTVFKINIALGKEIMKNIAIPEHRSVMKELPKGRLLFYVKFNESKAEMMELNHEK